MAENGTEGRVRLRGKAEPNPQEPGESKQIKSKGSGDYLECPWFPGKNSSAKGQYRESQQMDVEFMGLQLCVCRCSGLGER